MSEVAIAWFRRDLRLADNPALRAAVEGHTRLVPVYIDDPEGEGDWAPGEASRAWLSASLEALDASLRERGSALLFRRGAAAEVLTGLADACGAANVTCTRRPEPAAREQQDRVAEALAERGVAFRAERGSEWLDPDDLKTEAGTPYKVYTPFWNSFAAAFEPRAPRSAPDELPPLPDGVEGDPDAFRDLRPTLGWVGDVLGHWTPGERGAAEAMSRFSERIDAYADDRDFPAEPGTSRLSPHLAFGEIGPVQVVAAALAPHGGELLEPEQAWVRQIVWREFARCLLWHFPHMADSPWREEWSAFPWSGDDEERLERWRRGRTGVPMVDAGMHELWHSGWMHNRVRMIVASYLTKHLGQHWLHGARWFWDTLVDADLANNSMGWQWTAGSGPDASPYFRVFNPEKQGLRYDPGAQYLRRWLPRLADERGHGGLDDGPVSSAVARELHAARVDLDAGREAALARYEEFKKRR